MLGRRRRGLHTCAGRPVLIPRCCTCLLSCCVLSTLSLWQFRLPRAPCACSNAEVWTAKQPPCLPQAVVCTAQRLPVPAEVLRCGCTLPCSLLQAFAPIRCRKFTLQCCAACGGPAGKVAMH